MKKPKQLKQIGVNSRVRHNYVDGHGKGTVIEHHPERDQFNVRVMFDSGKGPFSYTYTPRIQEVAVLGA